MWEYRAVDSGLYPKPFNSLQGNYMITNATDKVKPESPKHSTQHPIQTSLQHPRQHAPHHRKAALVSLGVELLAMGEMDAVDAVTLIIRERRWSHE